MNDLKLRFSSRKFLLAVAALIVFTAVGQAELAVPIIISFLAAEGYIDAKATPTAESQQPQDADPFSAI